MMAKKKRQEGGVFEVLGFLKSAFEDLTAQDSEEKWILTPCTVNGEKSAAIALIKEKSRSTDIIPIFVGVTPNMVLLDPQGAPTERQGCEDCPDPDGCAARKRGSYHRVLH
jgi:hypothetical protein